MMPRDLLFRHLRDVLAGLYLHQVDAERLVKDALLDPRLIAFSSRAVDNWRAIVVAADQGRRLGELLDIAANENSASVPLQAGRDAFSAWQAAGRPLTPRELQLDTLAGAYNLRASWNGDLPLPLTQVGRLDGVFRHHQVFGGRLLALDHLDRFLAEQPGGHLLVTGPAGFGKSALLAEWIRRLQAAGQAVCYTFINRAEDLAGPAFTFQNLCEQLAHVHELIGALPGQATTLRSLYPELLRLPPQDGRKVAVVLDGLDEAVDWEPRADLFPPALPDGVYVVFSAREMPGVDWLAALKLASGPQNPLELAAMGLDDVQSLLEQSGGRAAALAAAPWFAQSIYDASRGDPFYLHFLVQDILDGEITEANAGHQPEGLNAYLEEWWDQLAREVNIVEANDLLGILSVANGRLLPGDLKRISPSLNKGLLLKKGLTGRLRRYLTGDEQTGYAIANPRFGRYLAEEAFDKDETGHYRDELLAYCSRWQQHRSRYALACYAGHLGEAIDGSPAAERSAAIQHLVELTGNRAFQEAHALVVSDLPALQADLERALVAAAAEDGPEMPLLAIESGLALVDWRARELRPGPLFARARQGRVDDALRRLDLFDIDAEWRQAIRLAIAWLALDGEATTDQSRAAARALLQAVQPQRPLGEPLGRLWDWLVSALDGTAPPEPDLRPAPPEELVRLILDRMAGSGDVEMLNRQAELLADPGLGLLPELGDQVGFLSRQDGPFLVAYARAHGPAGDVYLDRYIDIHTGYGYPQYRGRSLWLLLDAVLQHPEPAWVRRTVEKLATAALAGSEYDFREGLPIAAAGVLAREGADRAGFDLACQQAYDDAAPLLDREAGPTDLSGGYKRRLAAYAETLHLVMGTGDTLPLLDRAQQLNVGFAGYGMPAFLALAEAVHICWPENQGLLDAALYSATTSAHNINDETFCARSTARCSAMRALWWQPGGIPDLQGAARRLLKDRTAPEFAALHWVGEPYQGRQQEYRLPLPHASSARTLQALADLFKQPLAEFQRLNHDQGWAADEPLPDGMLVRVPDPEMAPLLAARFAAGALALPSLPPPARAGLIRSLLPAAAANPTALDTVLARLVLADPRPGDRLQALVAQFNAYLAGSRQPGAQQPGIPG